MLSRFDPSHQLEYLRKQANELAPVIYRDHALYLQVLRNDLLDAAKKSIFLLITDKDQNRLNKLSIETRNTFQETVNELISRSISLLTIEHLMDLVRQIEEEHRSNNERSKQKIINALNNSSPLSHSNGNSIELGLASPLDEPEKVEDFSTSNYDEDVDLIYERDVDVRDELFTPTDTDDESIPDNSQGDDLKSGEHKMDFFNSEFSDSSTNGFDILRSLFVMAGETIESKSDSSIDSEDSTELNNLLGDDELDNGILPSNPIDLMNWMHSIDNALSRRLRNLSYALNVELMRVGIVTSLVPRNLLETVLRGELESQSASSNILRIRLPLDLPLLSDGMDISCVLLRSSDLEFDNPRLRRCRQKLKQYRQELQIMVRKQRHWQARFLSQQAHEQWWQNPPDSEERG